MSTPHLPDRVFDAFLFDMDGTILTSIATGERVWSAWARRHGVDVASLLSHLHGVRAVDTIRRLQLPGVDPEAEAHALTLAEIADVDGIAAVAGAAAFLASLPPERWAIVTSAPLALAQRRIEVAGLPMPQVLVTADDVSKGKPAPDGFQLAAQRLGVQAQNCLVFEDATAGIQAAEAAGAAVVVIDAAHQSPPQTQHPCVAGYEGLVAQVQAQGLRLRHIAA